MSDFDCDPLFSRLYLEMLEQMTAYSARRLGDIGLAEDVAQDTFAECWKNWEQGQRVKHHPNPRGWLWEALKIKLKKMREDMEKVRTVPLDELAHPPAAPVERRLYLSDYLPPDTSRADRRIVRLRLEGYRYQEIAEKMEMPVERVREIMKISQDPVSLETPIGEEDDSHLGDFIQDDHVQVPVDAATYTLLHEQLMEVLDTLTEREQKVLRLRFGLDDGRPRTLEEVGRQFNVTRERIRQIEAKALRKLRHPSRSKKLKDYLDE